jgi:coenzyme F420-0:L-glutamate ligase
MIITPIRSGKINEKDDIADILFSCLKEKIRYGDIIVFASKIVSLWQGRVSDLSLIEPSDYAIKLGKKYSLESEFTELVIREADHIVGGVDKAILTIKNNIFIANAGIDRSNAPGNHAILWPDKPFEAAHMLRKKIEKKFGIKAGVIIADSHCTPLRLGTSGIAIAYAGFCPVADERGRKDIFGRKLKITQRNIADSLAASAVLLMGEADEKMPFAIIRNSGVKIKETKKTNVIKPNDCIFSSLYPRL